MCTNAIQVYLMLHSVLLSDLKQNSSHYLHLVHICNLAWCFEIVAGVADADHRHDWNVIFHELKFIMQLIIAKCYLVIYSLIMSVNCRITVQPTEIVNQQYMYLDRWCLSFPCSAAGKTHITAKHPNRKLPG